MGQGGARHIYILPSIHIKERRLPLTWLSWFWPVERVGRASATSKVMVAWCSVVFLQNSLIQSHSQYGHDKDCWCSAQFLYNTKSSCLSKETYTMHTT